MKIVLVNPRFDLNSKFSQHPLGLAKIASVIAEKNDVKIIDGNALLLNHEDVCRQVLDLEPDLVGFTSTTGCIPSTIKEAELIKSINPNITTVLGGVHASALPRETLEVNKCFDYLIFGEGEETFKEFLLSYDKTPESIKGLAYRKNDKVYVNSSRPLLEVLDSYPFTAYDLLPMKDYKPFQPYIMRKPYAPMMASRGCPFQCCYCYKELFGSRYRSNSPKYVIDEMKMLIEKFGIREINFYDDVFTMDIKRTKKICELIIENNLDVTWSCETRVDLIDEKLLTLMKKAGCHLIAYGVESGNRQILNRICKGVTLEQVEKAFKLTETAGIDVLAFFIIGSPTENKDTVTDTINFAKKLNPKYCQFSVLTPFPNSQIYQEWIKTHKDFSWERFVFADVSSSDFTRLPVYCTDDLSSEELLKWLSIAYKQYYVRWKYLYEHVFKHPSINGTKFLYYGFTKLLNSKFS